jgi:hypothetical protein
MVMSQSKAILRGLSLLLHCITEDPYLNGEDEAQARTVRKMSLAVAAAVEEALAGPEPATPTQPVPTRTTPRPPSSSGAAAEGKLGAQHPRAGVSGWVMMVFIKHTANSVGCL